jgi:hypothetical protein
MLHRNVFGTEFGLLVRRKNRFPPKLAGTCPAAASITSPLLVRDRAKPRQVEQICSTLSV